MGWRVFVPANLLTLDSSAWGQSYGQSESIYGYKGLIRISDSSSWQLNGSYLAASIKPFTNGSNLNALKEMSIEVRGSLDKDFLPKATIDSAYSQELVDGKEFYKSYFRVTRSNKTQHVLVYSTIIKGYVFNCLIFYSDSTTGKQFIDIFRRSKFD